MSGYEQYQEEPSSGLLASIPAILWQRRWLIIAPTILTTIAGVVAAFTLPPMYESSATVLIESQQLPTDPSQTSLNDMIDQRIARARERVLSRQDLIRLIRANGLYAAEQRRTPLSKIVEKMRDNTTISAVASDAGRSVMQGASTIALRIAFDYSDPAKAQIVAQQYVNRFLEVDASSQTDQAVGAANFLTEQSGQIQSQIAALEDQITKIKAANGPILALQQQSTGNPLADASRIDSDISNLQSENARLQMSASSGGGGDSAVAAAAANLRAAEARYSDTHPDVIAARAALAAAKQTSVAPVGNNSVVEMQIRANANQIQSLRSARAMLMSESTSARSAQARAPAVLAEIDQLEKRAELLRDQYRQIGGRTQNAQVSARMETQQKGERLTLADPPVVPDAPFRPNRPVLVMGAIAAGIAGGLALVLLMELLLRPIRGAKALEAAAGLPPIAIVPDFERKPHVIIRWLERRNRRKQART